MTEKKVSELDAVTTVADGDLIDLSTDQGAGSYLSKKITFANLAKGITGDPMEIIQSVSADANNSSTTNLSVSNSYTFTGTSTSTLGVAGIQVSLYADKNCTVNIEQSPNGTNWDLIDTYNYYADSNFGITVQAISSYVRVVVTTASLTTTYFRLQTALCPIVEAVPRSLDADGNFKVAIQSDKDEYGFVASNTPIGELRVVEPVRLVGAIFDGTTIDSNFWTSTTASTGTITQSNGEITLTVSTDAASSCKLNSVRRARYVSANALRFRGIIQLGDTGTANNNRKWGVGYGTTMPTITDGAYFKMQGLDFGIAVLKGSSETFVSTGNFNGTLGKTWTPTTSSYTYEIYWTNSYVWFSVNGKLLHKVTSTSTTWAATPSHYIYMDSINSGNTTSLTMKCRVASISRLGKSETAPIYKNFNTTAVTAYVLKRSAGKLHRVTFNTVPNSTIITLYDAITATNPICVMNPPNGATPFTMEFGLDFYNGLCITTTPNAVDCTVIYE